MARKPRYSATLCYLQQRNVPIVAGGWLSVSLTGNFLHLNKDERALADGLLGLIDAYQQAHPGVAVEIRDTMIVAEQGE